MKESFLQRWSRLKQAGGEPPVPTTAPAEAPALPPVESLDFSSDFTGFLRANVEESVKRAALAKLFHSGQFNQLDGLDVYIDDYSLAEPIPEETVQTLVARLRTALEPAPEHPGEGAAAQESQPHQNGEGTAGDAPELSTRNPVPE